MTKESVIEMDGAVFEILPDARFRVRLDNGRESRARRAASRRATQRRSEAG
jgi:translation initiation factor IF-1